GDRRSVPAEGSECRRLAHCRCVEVALETLDQLLRATGGAQGTAVHLVRRDAQALSGGPADEGGGEETVLTTKEDSCGHVRPRLKGRWLGHPSFGLCAPPAARLGRALRRHT